MKILRECIEEFGSNGFYIDDRGNGSGGETWIEWNEETEKEYGSIEMHSATDKDFEDHIYTWYDFEECSEWIDKGDDDYQIKVYF